MEHAGDLGNVIARTDGEVYFVIKVNGSHVQYLSIRLLKIYFLYDALSLIFNLCIIELTYCDNHEGLCENGGTCVSLTEEDGDFKCVCPDKFRGRHCEISKSVSRCFVSKTGT